jgi:hypothetical protein
MTPGDTYGRWTRSFLERILEHLLSALTVSNGLPAHFPQVHTPARDTWLQHWIQVARFRSMQGGWTWMKRFLVLPGLMGVLLFSGLSFLTCIKVLSDHCAQGILLLPPSSSMCTIPEHHNSSRPSSCDLRLHCCRGRWPPNSECYLSG